MHAFKVLVCNAGRKFEYFENEICFFSYEAESLPTSSFAPMRKEKKEKKNWKIKRKNNRKFEERRKNVVFCLQNTEEPNDGLGVFFPKSFPFFKYTIIIIIIII